MKEFELIQKVRAGETEAFKKWMDSYSGDIERFAVQFGCSLKQAGEVAEKTFRNLHIQLESFDTEESLVCALYKNALNSLAFAQQAEPANEAILAFKEDQELHDQIVKLETGIKVPFILSEFHKLDELEIAAIMDTSPEGVQQAITAAQNQLEDAQLEKRLEFLDKSYLRMRTSFRKEMVFAKLQQEIRATGELKQTISKKAVISWITGIIALLLLAIIPIITGEEYKKASAEKYVERLKESFEQEIESRYSELGLTELNEEEKLKYDHIYYGEQARPDFESMIARFEGVIEETGTMNKKKLEDEYGIIMTKLELPSEMVGRLVKNSLSNDKVKSEEFMKGYLEQYDALQQAYYLTFIQHEQIIADATVNESLNADTFIQKKDTYPKELQQAVDGMIKQNIYPMFIKGRAELVPVYGKNSFSAKVRALIHEDFAGFFTVLESAPFVSYPGLTHSLEESANFMLEIEKTLLATAIDDEKTGMLRGTYSELLYEIVGGAEPNKVFDIDGKVKKEYQATWERIESAGEGSPSAYIMQHIISEMEATDWTNSQSRNYVDSYYIQQALELVKNEELDTFKISGIIKSETGLDSVTFPDAYFEDLVKETYYSFASGHDHSVLQGVNPLVIIGVYFYANKREDTETMWNLYGKKHNTTTRREYVNSWSQFDLDLNDFDSLQFEGNEEIAGSVGFQRGNTTFYSAQMVLNDDSVWEIDYIDLDMLLVE